MTPIPFLRRIVFGKNCVREELFCEELFSRRIVLGRIVLGRIVWEELNGSPTGAAQWESKIGYRGHVKKNLKI